MKKRAVKDKPKEIIEIERLNNIELSEAKLIKGKSMARTYPREGNSFTKDTGGKIITIDITNSDLKNIETLAALDLIELNLTSNIIEDIAPLVSMKNLKYLYIGGNRIKDLEPISGCLLLEELAVWGNLIDNMSPVSNLKNLKNLYAQSMKLKNIDFIEGLDNLDELALTRNKIEDVEKLLLLKRPIFVSLESNNINKISIDVAKKYNWLNRSFSEPTNKIGITLNDNPLYYPPTSVLELGSETIKNYYQSAEQYGHAPLSEGRIIVIGDGSAGKSSLIERILHDTFDQNKTQTNGIKIDHLKLNHHDGRDLIFHIWDFGGQEIQHAVHKFFFTEGCLYLLVLDNRKEEEPEYWLQQIESLGGGAPVMVVFNKHDDNPTEIADRKYLKEKYPNIVGFYSVSCKTGMGIYNLSKELEKNSILLRTVEEQFPFNWFKIKKAIEECTSGSQHYLDYASYRKICSQNNATNEITQKLLLKYFTTIGAVTWFGDTFLHFLHVLSPAWITQGVYKIITSKRTSELLGKINIADFKDLLKPINENDYTYDETHYGYILSMMKKFDLCYTPDDIIILIPSAFGKVPNVEYSDFKGQGIRTYILQFKDYMPIAVIHRYIAKRLPDAFENNYWYTGIVIQDRKSDSLAMIHIDREAKRIYIRIKGNSPLGLWESVRREIFDITSDYAKIPYNELISLDDISDSTVNYDDIVSFLKAKKETYYHPKLERDFNVGYLLGFFQTQEQTIEKLRKGLIEIERSDISDDRKSIPPVYLQIVNNINPNINVNTNIDIDINVEIINDLSISIKGEATYLIEELQTNQQEIKEILEKIIQFVDDTKKAKSIDEIKEKGWGRRIKGVMQSLIGFGDQLKHLKDGGEAFSTILHKMVDLLSHFHFNETVEQIDAFLNVFKK